MDSVLPSPFFLVKIDCRVKPDNDIATFAKQNVGKYATAYDSFPGLTRESLLKLSFLFL